MWKDEKKEKKKKGGGRIRRRGCGRRQMDVRWGRLGGAKSVIESRGNREREA